jgi:signal transduction histidine kinase
MKNRKIAKEKKTEIQIEPGIIKTFRMYALIRFILGIITAILIIFIKSNLTTLSEQRRILFDLKIPDIYLNGPLINFNLLVLVSLGFSALLLLYLHSAILKNKLNNAYIPIGLLLAVGTIIYEKQFFSPLNFLWQQSVFIYSLAIITAWQYSYKTVFISSISYFFLNLLFEISRFKHIPNDVTDPEFQRRLFRFGESLPELISLLFIGLIINRLIESQRQHRQQLTQAYQQLEKTNETIEELTINRERARLSRELHDILAHTLSGLSVQIQAILVAFDLNPAKAKTMLENSVTTIDSGLKETRQALKNLRPSFVDELGLVYAIKTKAENLAQQNNWHLELTLPNQQIDLPENVESTFYRIFQESLTNIIKHADTDHVAIALNKIKNKIILNITDNGKGYNLSHTTEGIGIKGMKERASLIDATLEIHSQIDQGTAITLIWEKQE